MALHPFSQLEDTKQHKKYQLKQHFAFTYMISFGPSRIQGAL